jgi:hypothetical protein
MTETIVDYWQQWSVAIFHRVTLIVLRATGLALILAAIAKAVDPSELYNWLVQLALGAHWSYCVPYLIAALITVELFIGCFATVSPSRAAPWVCILFSAFFGIHMGEWISTSESNCPCFPFVEHANQPWMKFATVSIASVVVMVSSAINTFR